VTRAISDPTSWRVRAEEQRTIGEVMRHPLCRATMLHLAGKSERMADRLERGAAAPAVVSDGDLAERVIFELYNSSLYWILRERTPPHDINEVSEWATVRMAAKIFGRSPREVAADLIERADIAS
jgi:hypothetical protein